MRARALNYLAVPPSMFGVVAEGHREIQQGGGGAAGDRETLRT